MGTRKYMLGDTRVPSVTTVLGVLAKPALVHWAWKLGMRGESYQKASADAADIGTMTHQLWEAWLKCEDLALPPGDDCDKARALFGRLRTYAEHEDWQPLTVLDCDGNDVRAEIALVSETYGYGGTMDCVVRDNEERTLIVDVKTSPRAYDEHWHQLAAYAQLLDECCGVKADMGVVVCVPRDGSLVKVYECEDLSADWSVFLASLGVYKHQRARKKVACVEHDIGEGEL